MTSNCTQKNIYIVYTDVDGTASEQPLYQGFINKMSSKGYITNEHIKKIKEALGIRCWEEKVKTVAGIIFEKPLSIEIYNNLCDEVIKKTRPRTCFKHLVDDVKPDKIYAFSGSEEGAVKKWLRYYFDGYEIEVHGTTLKREGDSITGVIEDMWDGEKRRSFVEKNGGAGITRLGLGNEENDIPVLEACDSRIYLGKDNPKGIENQKIYRSIDEFLQSYEFLQSCKDRPYSMPIKPTLELPTHTPPGF